LRIAGASGHKQAENQKTDARMTNQIRSNDQ
jgi:hypothetical protein